MAIALTLASLNVPLAVVLLICLSNVKMESVLRPLVNVDQEYNNKPLIPPVLISSVPVDIVCWMKCHVLPLGPVSKAIRDVRMVLVGFLRGSVLSILLFVPLILLIYVQRVFVLGIRTHVWILMVVMQGVVISVQMANVLRINHNAIKILKVITTLM